MVPNPQHAMLAPPPPTAATIGTAVRSGEKGGEGGPGGVASLPPLQQPPSATTMSTPSAPPPPPPTPATAAGVAPAPASAPTPQYRPRVVPKPKRPLTAYNLYFQHERERIVTDGVSPLEETESASLLMEKLLVRGRANANSNAAAAPGGGEAEPPPRRRRKKGGHGRVGFAQLARTVSHKWKRLDRERRAVFEALADIDRQRYVREMTEYRKALAEEEARKATAAGAGAAAAGGGGAAATSSASASAPLSTGAGAGAGAAAAAVAAAKKKAARAAKSSDRRTSPSLATAASAPVPRQASASPPRPSSFAATATAATDSLSLPPPFAAQQRPLSPPPPAIRGGRDGGGGGDSGSGGDGGGGGGGGDGDNGGGSGCGSDDSLEPTALAEITPPPDDPAEFLLSTFQDDALHPFVPRVTLSEMRRELDVLTLSEREEVIADLHGLGGGMGPVGHLEGLMGELIRALRMEIMRIPQEEKEGLLRCWEKCDRGKEFCDERLALFLQREGMDVKSAARRVVNYWNRRLELFGPNKFYLPMTLNGALRDDAVAAETGTLQIMPQPDALGRMVVVYERSRHTREGYTTESLLRYHWYMLESVLEYPSARDGVTFLFWEANTSLWNFDRRVNLASAEMERKFIPVKFSALHWCSPSFAVLNFLLPISMAIAERSQRARTRVHTDEVLYQSLSEYGISRHMMPVPLGGLVPFDYQRWLRARRDAGR